MRSVSISHKEMYFLFDRMIVFVQKVGFFSVDPSERISSGSSGRIDSFEPTSVESFDEFRKLLTDKLTKLDVRENGLHWRWTFSVRTGVFLFQKSEFYPAFLNSLFQDLALNCTTLALFFHTSSGKWTIPWYYMCFILQCRLKTCGSSVRPSPPWPVKRPNTKRKRYDTPIRASNFPQPFSSSPLLLYLD